MPYLRNPNVRWFDVDTSNLQLMPFEQHEQDRFGLEKGDVVICEGGEAGRAAIWEGQLPDVKFQKAIHRVRPGKHLYNRYLVHRLMADYHAGRLSDYYTGTTIKHLTGQDLRKYRFPLPPLPEQRRIAEILDKANALRAKRRAALALLDELTQSIFLDMFGDPVTNPKGWDVSTIGDHATKIGSGATPRGGNESYKDFGISLIRSLNVRDGTLTLKDLAFIDERQAAKLANVVVEQDDVLLNITGASVARVCRAPQSILPARVNQHVCVIRVNGTVEPLFLEQQLLAQPVKRKLLGIAAAGATRQAITKAQVQRFPIILPDLDTQREFVRRVAQVEQLRCHTRTATISFDSLFTSVQQRAFRGEL